MNFVSIFCYFVSYGKFVNLVKIKSYKLIKDNKYNLLSSPQVQLFANLQSGRLTDRTDTEAGITRTQARLRHIR